MDVQDKSGHDHNAVKCCHAAGLRRATAACPQPFEAALERARFFREQTTRLSHRRFDVIALSRLDRRHESRAPARQRRFPCGERGKHREILVLAEAIAHALRLVDPEAAQSWPQRLGQLHLVAMHDHTRRNSCNSSALAADQSDGIARRARP